MDTELDQMVTDNAIPGKRKRSPRPGSPTTGQNIRTSKELSQEAPGAHVLQATPKKQRIDTVFLDADQDQPIPVPLGSDNVCRLSSQCLPPEVMHRILSFVDPFSLGRLMRVNRDLHDLLLPRHETLRTSTGTNVLILSAENIWSYSRNTFCPEMPHPLNDVTEVDMFRLVYGRRCQHCQLLPEPSAANQDPKPWTSGPGLFGVRTIWPFKVKSCAKCLEPLLIKETEFIKLGCSQLRPGLVSVSFTPSLHYIMSITTKASLPGDLKLTSYYYRPHVEAVLQSSSRAQEQGATYHQSWIQQLDVLRQKAIEDIRRLESWELSRNAPSRHLPARSNMTSRSSASGSSLHSETVSRSYRTAPTGGHQAFTAISSHSGRGSSMMSSSQLRHNTGLRQLPPEPDHRGILNHMQNTIAHPRPQRFTNSLEESLPRTDQPSSDLIRLRGEKRADIERRCMELMPPILPQVLDTLPAFGRAIQALMPLDHVSWETLKRQLLDQRQTLGLSRVAASQIPSQTDSMDTSTIGRATTPEAKFAEVDLRKQALRPVREKLYDFAREYVHRRYASGTGLTHSSAPQFAADVLLYVRQRFYQNQADEDAAFTQHGEQPPVEGPSGIRTRMLKLEHMRYVFDTSIKPFTEFVRKDLFLCSACDTQGRHFAFEAIIQHFASKHTDAFSRGSAMVYWKAEWPLQPPFEPEPGRDSDTASSLLYPPTGSQFPLYDQPQAAINTALMGRTDRDDQGQRDFHQLLDPMQWNHSRIEPVHYVHQDEIVPISSVYHPATQSLTQVRDNVSYSSDAALARRSMHHAGHDPYLLLPAQNVLKDDSDLEHRPLGDEHRRYRGHNAYVFANSSNQENFHRDVPMTEAIPSVGIVYEREQPTAAADHYFNRIRPFRHVEDRGTEWDDPRRGSYDNYTGSEARFVVMEGQAEVQHRSFIRDLQPVDSPSRNSTTSSTQFQSETGMRRSNAQMRAPNPQQNAAERFLETFDLDGVQGHEKGLSRPGSVSQISYYLPLEEIEPREVVLDRRANVSHYRRATQSNLDPAMEQVLPAAAASGGEFWDRSARDSNPAYDRSRHDQHESGHRQLEDIPHDNMHGYDRPPSSHMRYHEHFFDDSRSLDPRPHQYQRIRYVDEYGRELEPPSPEARYTQPGPYREISTEMHHYHDDPSRTSSYYGRPSYGDHEARLSHESRRYYVERPMHDELSNRQYIEPSHSPRREVIYEDDPQHPQFQPHAARPSLNDPRYERR